MAAVPKMMYRGVPANTTANTVGTVPTGYRWIVTNVVLQSGSSTVPSTVTITLDGIWLMLVTLQPLQQYVLDCRQVLDAAKTIAVTTTVASSVNVHISGIEQGL